MSLATEPTEALTPDQKAIYQALARAALQQYALGATTTLFVQHNAGIVFQITDKASGLSYLLKLYKRVGVGDDPDPAELEAGLQWLAALSQATDVLVQAPLPTWHGCYVGAVAHPETGSPIACTLQHWIDGRVPNGDFTLVQAQQLGMLMAQLHHFSRTFTRRVDVPGTRHDATALRDNIQLLCSRLPTSVLSAHDITLLLAAQERVVEVMHRRGYTVDVWGPVHGDLHYDNILIVQDAILCPIDFTGYRLAHYLYDLGVTLYHTYHQGTAFRAAFYAGYQSQGSISPEDQQDIAAFLVAAAVDNLAWNATITTQVTSALFYRNIRQLLDTFCRPLVEGTGVPFP